MYHICEFRGNIVKAPHCGGKKRLRSNTCEHERHDNANSELSFTVVRSAVEKAGGDFMARSSFLMAGFVAQFYSFEPVELIEFEVCSKIKHLRDDTTSLILVKSMRFFIKTENQRH